MDGYVKQVEELFSAATTAFKHLKYYYFHNCLYEGVWQDNRRRWSEQTPTMEIMRTYSKEYKCIFVGDASMSPYEILMVEELIDTSIKNQVKFGWNELCAVALKYMDQSN